MRGAKLQEADFNGAILWETIFSGAYLTNADFRDADLSGAILRRAEFDFAKYNKRTNFKDIDWGLVNHPHATIGAMDRVD